MCPKCKTGFLSPDWYGDIQCKNCGWAGVTNSNPPPPEKEPARMVEIHGRREEAQRLHYELGMDVASIAEAMGISLQSVRNYI